MFKWGTFLILAAWGGLVQAQQIVNMEGRRFEYPKNGLQGNVEFGANYTQIANQVLQFSNRFMLIHHNAKRNWLLNNDFSFISANGQNLVNSGFQHIRYIMLGDSTIFPEAFVQTQYNKQLALTLRALGGVGLRYRIYRDEKSFFYVGNVLMYEYETYPELPSQRNFRMSSYASLDISEWDYLPITFVAYLQPKLTDVTDYRVSLEASLVFKSKSKFVFRTQARYVYDAFPPPGINKLFGSMNNTLVYLF